MTNTEKKCPDCGVSPGENHKGGCDVERCALCGGQAIGCDCVYESAGIDPFELETTHPEVYMNGPTPEIEAAHDAEIAKCGGPLPWTGEWPGRAECREFGWFCDKDNPRRRCAADDPGATEDLNRLVWARWDKEARRFVAPAGARG